LPTLRTHPPQVMPEIPKVTVCIKDSLR